METMEDGKIDPPHLDDLEAKTEEEGLAENIGPLIDNSRNLIESKQNILHEQKCDDTQNGDVKIKTAVHRPLAENCENYGQGDYDAQITNSFTLHRIFTKHMYTRENSDEKFGSPASDTKSEIETVFYGVNVPVGTSAEDEIDQVYTDRKEVLKAVKKCKGARFKVFKTEVEALDFANTESEQLNSSRCSDQLPETNSISNGERISRFRPPRNQDLVKLRKSIECGDIESVTETVWSNPRYLVGNGDTPTILQEGSRYNALHVAAKMKQSEIAKVIINIIESEKFMQLLYNDDNEITCLESIHFLNDLYLNTPDKGLNESPLHFASKFGSLEIVNLLVSHPLCDLNLKNKYGQTALEIICTRCPNETSELRSAIEDCFHNRFYVPVLRTVDNTQLPSIGEPWSPSIKKPLVRRNSTDSPLDLPLSVKAYAGPMSPTQAVEFHKKISAPARSKFKRSISFVEKCYDVRLSDLDKGLERLGRELATEMKVGWTEFWPFLKCYCDLSKPEGLGKFESYLKNKYNEIVAKEHEKRLSDKDLDQSLNVGSNDGISFLCQALRNLHLDSGSFSSERDINSTINSGTNNSPCICPRRMRCQSGPASFRDTSTSFSMDSFLQRTCEVIGDQILAETSRFTKSSEALEDNLVQLLNPHKSFGKAILPYVKCLYDIAARLADDPMAKDNFKCIHGKVAAHVIQAVISNEEYGIKEFFRILNVPDTELVVLSDLSDDLLDCNERVQKVKRKRNKNLVPVMGSHLKCLTLMLTLAATQDENCALKECDCDWTVRKSEVGVDEVFGDDSAADRGGSTKPISVPQVTDDLSLSKSLQSVASDASTDLYFTPESSFKSSICSSMSDACTPDEGLAVYIEGLTISKIDIDVMRALENVNVDAVLYPNIHRYKFFMNNRRQDQGVSFADSFQALRSSSFSHSNHPLTSTPSNKKMFFNPFLARNNANDLQFPDLFQD